MQSSIMMRAASIGSCSSGRAGALPSPSLSPPWPSLPLPPWPSLPPAPLRGSSSAARSMRGRGLQEGEDGARARGGGRVGVQACGIHAVDSSRSNTAP